MHGVQNILGRTHCLRSSKFLQSGRTLFACCLQYVTSTGTVYWKQATLLSEGIKGRNQEGPSRPLRSLSKGIPVDSPEINGQCDYAAFGSLSNAQFRKVSHFSKNLNVTHPHHLPAACCSQL